MQRKHLISLVDVCLQASSLAFPAVEASFSSFVSLSSFDSLDEEESHRRHR